MMQVYLVDRRLSCDPLTVLIGVEKQDKSQPSTVVGRSSIADN
jgi:hypothetical protein